MATDRAFFDYVIEQLALGERLTHKRMFGEYALYVDGKVVAFACDDSLFIKPNAAVARLHPQLPQRPIFPGSKDYALADELLDDGEALRALFIASFEALPEAKAKKIAVAKKSPRKR